jgi:hypothetical protein
VDTRGVDKIGFRVLFIFFYCQTIENKTRSMFAIGLQSIGYHQFYKHVFALTGIPLIEDDITGLFLRSQEGQKLWRQLHRYKEYVKITRIRTLYKKLRDGVAKMKVDNTKLLGYKTWMMGSGGGEEEHGRRQKQKTGAGPKPICPLTAGVPHTREE